MKKNEAGQAVLIVLLSLSVVLIIVMYILSRTITDISLSGKDENSMRAFSAAEAGVERALVIGSDQGGSVGDAQFNATVTNFAQGEESVIYPVSLKSGESAVFWLKRDGDPTVFLGNNLKVCWGQSGTASNESLTPAIEVSFYFDSKIARVVVDPNTTRLSTEGISNNFESISGSNCEIDGESFAFYKNINLGSLGINPLVNNLYFMSARLLYNTTIGHKIALDVTGSGMLPAQGVKVKSTGSFDEANRTIEVYELYPAIPDIFTNTIFSVNGITL